MQIRQAEKHMQTSLWGIAQRSKKDCKHRFGNLYSLLNEKNLAWCLPQLNRQASSGVDKKSWQDFHKEAENNISRMVETLKRGTYKAKLILRRYIPKEGGRRPLGIPVVGDKLLQYAVSQILSAIYESVFLPFSHGYQRGKGPQRAALELSKTIHRGRYGWIVDADIKGFFNHLDHDWLMRFLEHRINDRRFLGLIRKWLKAGILEDDGKIIYPVTGTPQGGVVSSVLANIYLHYVLDLWFDKRVKPWCKGDATMIRYADDFVCCFQYYKEAQEFYRVLSLRLGKFNLELSKEKSQLIRFTRFETDKSTIFSFLGFEYYWSTSRKGKPVVKMQTSKKKFRAALASFLNWIKTERSKQSTRLLFIKVKQKIQGHFNYYGVCNNSTRLWKFYDQVIRIMYKWCNRRSQRRSFNWTIFNEMLIYYAIPRPRISAYW